MGEWVSEWLHEWADTPLGGETPSSPRMLHAPKESDLGLSLMGVP